MARPDLPYVSIVVPTHDRPAQLAACVAALSRLRYPHDRLEIVVVDDGSPTPVDRGSLDHGRVRLQVARQGRAGPAAARNAGAGLADGELLAFADDDCMPEPSWLEHLVPHLGDDRRAIAGGRTVNSLPDNRFADASQALVAYLYDYYATYHPERQYFTSNNFAMRREQFLELGGFDTRFARAAGEDREFCVRSAHRGFELVFEPKAVVGHAHPLALRSYWRQHLAYGRAARMYRALVDGPSEGTFEPLAFYGRLVTYPHQQELRRPFELSALLLIAQLATVLGYVLEARRSSSRME